MDIDQLKASLDEIRRPFQFVCAAFMSIIFWEYIIWLPNEVHVWRKLFGRARISSSDTNRRPTMAEWLAIWMRYNMVGCAISVGIFVFGRPPSCQATVTTMCTFAVLCWAGISMLFTLRLYVIYGRSRVILVVFGFLWLAALAAWVIVVTSWRASAQPALLPDGAPWCVQSINTKHWRTANLGAEMTFDLLVLIATLVRLHQLRKATREITVINSSSRQMKSYILRSNLGYFVVSFLLSTASFVVQNTVVDPALSEILLPPLLSLTPIIAIRIVFSVTNQVAIDDLLPKKTTSDPEHIEVLSISTSNHTHGHTKHSPSSSLQPVPSLPSRRHSPLFTTKEITTLTKTISGSEKQDYLAYEETHAPAPPPPSSSVGRLSGNTFVSPNSPAQYYI